MSKDYVPPINRDGVPIQIPELPLEVEKAIRKKIFNKANEKCEPFLNEVNKCKESRYFFEFWACKDEIIAYDKCINRYNNEDEVVRLKIAYINQQQKSIVQNK